MTRKRADLLEAYLRHRKDEARAKMAADRLLSEMLDDYRAATTPFPGPQDDSAKLRTEAAPVAAENGPKPAPVCEHVWITVSARYNDGVTKAPFAWCLHCHATKPRYNTVPNPVPPGSPPAPELFLRTLSTGFDWSPDARKAQRRKNDPCDALWMTQCHG